MADKAISDLTQALQITNEDLFVLQQNGKAKKLKGATLLDFVTLNVVSVTVTTLPAGSSATAIYDKSTGTLALGIPQGSKGDTGATGATGPANVLTIGSVTSGKVASATITGEAPNQVLNLVLEKGDKGEPGEKGATGGIGPQGEQGIQGPQGSPGTDAPTITNITIRQSDYHLIVTLSDGTSYDAGYCRGAAGAGSGDMLASVYDPNNKHQDIFAYVDNAIKDVKVTTDATPTQGSTNPVQSGGVYSALVNKLDKPASDASATAGQVLTKTADGQEWADAAGSVFWATYNETTLNEIKEAHNAGKQVFVKDGAIIAALSAIGVNARFVSVDMTRQYVYVRTSSVWTKAQSFTGLFPEDYDTRTSSLIKNDGNGGGGLVAAVPGSDYIASGNIVKQTLVASETTPTENYAINWLFG